MKYTEDTLVQQTTANYLKEQLKWKSVYAYDREDYGENSLLGRKDATEIILTRYLKQKLRDFNKNLPEEAYNSAIRQIKETAISQSLLVTNQEKYNLFLDGVPVTYRNNKGELTKKKLKVFDFNNPEDNDFLIVRELWIKGNIYRRRADLVGFVNGIPLLFMEVKNLHRDTQAAYEENFLDYLDTIPHLFYYNAFVVLGNGIDARIGSFSSPYQYFHQWKRLAEIEPGVVDMETLLKGVCDKNNFMDLFENYILFDDSSGKTNKIIAQNHQYLGVNLALESVNNRQDNQGKLGVFWHTQGAGKSYSMVFFTRKIRRKLGGNFTFLICTDRDDLDKQIYDTYAGCGLVNNDKEPCRAGSGEHLKNLLGEQKAYIFTLIQKFNQEIDPNQPYTNRSDIIVISDEAHRTQYGILARNLRDAVPNASFIGFTGTPLFNDDEITRRYFGEYVSTYDFQRAVEDNATVPLYYDARGDKLNIATNDLNEQIAAKIEELSLEDQDIEQRLEKELRREYQIITDEKRLREIAQDFVTHYSTSWETGKGMFICIDKVTCGRMYELIVHYWQERIKQLKKQLKTLSDEQEAIYQQRQIKWMEETLTAVIISEEQGEVAKFAQWELDITPHRTLIKNGFELDDGKRISVEKAFKDPEHPFRIAIVCAMWLTGFDVPSLSTLYLDKPLKAHTLMQGIARANRVHEGKNNGLIVDYCGILKNLRQALATFAGTGDAGRENKDLTVDPTQPNINLLAELAEAIKEVKEFLQESNASLDDILDYKNPSFALNKAIMSAKEAANQNDETRKRFDILCREVFKKYQACLNVPEVNQYRQAHNAIKFIYKCLQEDLAKTDITEILRELQLVVSQAIEVSREDTEERELYDISQIDFDRLKQEFSKSQAKNTTVQTLKNAIEIRLRQMLARNPQRTNFQRHYEEMIANYNHEKDRLVIEQTFEALLIFVQNLDEESSRGVREGLDEESLAIFDLLRKNKENLSPQTIKKIKNIATQLLEILKQEKLKIDNWRDKESTRDGVRGTIYDFLYSDETGLPIDSYSEDEVSEKTEEVFRHIFRVYPTLPSPYYDTAA